MNRVFVSLSIIALAFSSLNYSIKATADQGTNTAPKLASMGHIEIIDDEAKEFLDDSSTISLLADGFMWTEGPLWLHESKTLIFSDIPNNKIHQYSDKDGLSLYLDKAGATGLVDGDNSQGSNGMFLNKSGQLVLLHQGDRRVALMDAPLSKPASKFITLAGDYNGLRLNSPNDGVIDNQGNIFFTDPAYGLTDRLNDIRKELPFQGVYRLDTSGKLSLLDDDIMFPNGIAISPDNKTLYVAVSDEKKPVWFAYDIQSDGKLINKRVFHDALKNNPNHDIGVPDGMAVHSSGVIFATGPGGVWLLNKNGKLLAKIHTGKLTANCTLSSDEKYLFMTAHDSVFKINLK